ncbi:ribbon-helix-helix protein, CopG family [Schaalia georgiae]|nr:ribbon-helix-helix protein, CopG family [Schaalia georgiae]
MPTMTMRIDEEDAAIVRKYAEFEGKTISDFIRDAVLEKIEDQQDLDALRAAVADDNGEHRTHAQVLEELGL